MSVLLRHEAREFPSRNGLSFGLATTEGLATLERIDGPSELLYVVYASTHEAAMQMHYDRQNWGAYDPVPGLTDPPYDQAELERQLAEYPNDDELRRLNGVPA